ncbi:MAG TPA: hypothetical protein VJ865_07415, partial [Gemmatimonadaceae bacterium]|nr:hypothetical protein [Gemmatimonadaceae bacterium]
MKTLRSFPRLELWAAIFALFVRAAPADAQHLESTLDLGGVAIQYADTLNGVAGTINPRFLLDWGNRLAEASGTYSQFGRDWSVQGQASGSLFIPLRFVVGELSGFAGGSTHRDGSRTGEFLANARIHAQQRYAEWFLGAGAGQT